ncbi:hypothetical protein THRCLA_03447 [Thraustotheca clavata]|uniref:Secreted protein n=1 Tax=Thraustotheca clavata TaxID=74557 RepID=A0A0A7CM52_9STRA|nr:secreted protein [Thraustotheca clavata]OQS04300.1 hypothetical protein THRCLA_03447 [Thraustotheca clavata]
MVIAISLFLLAAVCIAKEFTGDVLEIDVVPLVPYEPYALPRMRWTDLNRALGMEASGKMLKVDQVDTFLGKIGVPKEDQKAFEKLSQLEVNSLFGDDEYDKERDVLIAMEMLDEGEIDAGIEMLEQVKAHVERTRGKKHPLYANAMADLGYAFMLKRDFAASHKELLKAMELDEEIQEEFGVYNLAASINLMATSALRSGGGQFEALSAAYETAFNALHKIEHPARFKILMNMANMYRNQWLPLRAIQMFKLAKQYEKEQRIVGDLQLGLGISYLMLGEAKQAHDILESVVGIYEEQGKTGAKNYVETVYQLATSEIQLHHFGRALRRLQSLRKMHLIQSNPLAQALVMTSIGDCLLEMGYVDQSIGILEAAMALLQEHPADPNNELKPYLPVIHIKLLHWTAKAWDIHDANSTSTLNHHEIAYERSRMVFGENHPLTKMHHITS